MKNFDLDNLERKNSFATPPDFFADMQNNVLNKTVNQKKEARIIPINFRWAAAAAVVVIGGLSFWTLNNQNLDDQSTVAQHKEIIDSSYTLKSDEALALNDNIKPEVNADSYSSQPKHKDTETKEEHHQSHIATTDTQNQNLAMAKTAVQTPIASFAKVNKNPDAKISQVLAVLTPDQVSDLDKTVDQDVYLDLYN